MKYWHVPPEWRGHTAIIVCGGTSVTPDTISLLRRVHERDDVHVIAVNSTYLTVPWADMLFFADERWWTRENKERPLSVEAFSGYAVTTSLLARGDHLLRLRKMVPTKDQGLCIKRNEVALQRTSLQGALNICYHEDVSRVVLLGADNRDGLDGRAHYHDEYPWARRKNTWKVKVDQLAHTVAPLKEAGIEVINASPISTLPWWPKTELERIYG